MQVVLKVVGGKNDGREIKIAVPEFIIGRGEEAHLRPTSDLVSRKHVSIKVADGKVVIADMNSRNGTFINGERISEPHTCKAGDSLRVGRLQFEVVIDHVKPSTKKPRVTGVVEAAARTASSGKKASIEDSIADWLVDEEEDARDADKKMRDAKTVQLDLEETLSISRESLDKTDESSEQNSEEISAQSDTGEIEGSDDKKKKKKPGKLPPVPKMSHLSSTTAADDVLRKFFNRR